jgi:hypothetical protein
MALKGLRPGPFRGDTPANYGHRARRTIYRTIYAPSELGPGALFNSDVKKAAPGGHLGAALTASMLFRE